MDIVAALEAQQMQRMGIDVNIEPTFTSNEISANTNEANHSPKEMRKFDSKKRWKNWGWKHSPGGKPSSIEEEPTESNSAKTSRHSSPTSSPKHKKSNETTSAMVVSNILNQSPLRRRPQSSRSNGRMITNKNNNTTNATPNQTNRNEIRSSAGARLCQTLENLQDDANEEFQALIINGRPASVHIVPMFSAQNS